MSTFSRLRRVVPPYLRWREFRMRPADTPPYRSCLSSSQKERDPEFAKMLEEQSKAKAGKGKKKAAS